ncbi:MAG: NAD(P)-binding domain-containing protein [Armatimonadota bacterium]|nr:NAD(P)-binding domain-containing protein [Armatimonadota bacterium]
MKKIGFIGLGVMGSPMARHIIEKFGSAVVFDVDPSRMEPFRPVGAELAQGIADLAEKVDVAILSLPGSAIVREVVTGPGGLASAMREGGIVIDTSTTEPAVSIEVGKALAERGVKFLDAPVSGGEKAAIDGTLAFMVGGDEQTFSDCVELLGAMGSPVRVGGIGMGEAAKLVNNMIVGATFAIVAEAFALGVRHGLDPKVLYEAIRAGWAGSKVLDVSVSAMLARDFKPGGTVNIHWKDLGYALSLAKDEDVPLPVTALVHEIFKAARADGKGALSQPAIVTLWERFIGAEVKSQGP